MSEKLPQRKTMRMPSHDYNSSGAYFLTICTQGRKCLLSKVGTGVLDGPPIQLTEYGKTAEKYLKQLDAFYPHISVEHYVIMPNHIHLLLLISAESGPSGTPVPTKQNAVISRFVSTFKRFCNKEYGKNIWQARSYDHIVRDRQDYETRARYIYENPLRWREDELFEGE